MCDGFFRDPRHLENMFFHCAETCISDKVKHTLEGHLGEKLDRIFMSNNVIVNISENMEEYLISMNNTLEFTENLDRIKDHCGLVFSGSQVHKYIHILVNNNVRMYDIFKYFLFRGWQEIILMEMGQPL